jgi:hypothetical protein
MRPFCPSPLLEIEEVTDLPSTGTGTVVLHDIAQLTRAQQRAVMAWTDPPGHPWSLLTTSAEPLLPRLVSGESSGYLYYRLNTFTFDCEEIEL